MATGANPLPTGEETADFEPEEVEFVVDQSGAVSVGDGQAGQDIPCSDKPPSGNRKLRARFGRRRMHNKQIIVAPCGVVIARATFYGAEGVSTVAVSWACSLSVT